MALDAADAATKDVTSEYSQVKREHVAGAKSVWIHRYRAP